MEPVRIPSVASAMKTGAMPSSGIVCFQRSIPGATSPEILVHVIFDSDSNHGIGTSPFSGLPLGPPSANGWTAREVAKALKNYVAVTPRVRQRLHQAVDRNPWGQVTEKLLPSGAKDSWGNILNNKSVAIWVVNLTPAASHDLLDWKDNVEFDSDCRWIPSTTALAVDHRGGLTRAQKVNAIYAKKKPPPAEHRVRPSRSLRGGRFSYDKAMKLHGQDSSYYRTVGHVYPATATGASVVAAAAPTEPPSAEDSNLLDPSSHSDPSSPTPVPTPNTGRSRWGAPSNHGRRGMGNICQNGEAASLEEVPRSETNPESATQLPPRCSESV
jgi:hypothetical protein